MTYRFEINVDPRDRTHGERSGERRMGSGTSDNLGPDRRKPIRDRRVTRPVPAKRKAAKPATAAKALAAASIKATTGAPRAALAPLRPESDASADTTQTVRKPRAASREVASQTLGLIGLVAAYLQYYFLDVYLQISCLPLVCPLLTT